MSNNQVLDDKKLDQKNDICRCSTRNKVERTCRRCHRTWMGHISYAERTANCPTHRLQVCINGSYHLYCKKCDNDINDEVQEFLSSKNQIHRKPNYF